MEGVNYHGATLNINIGPTNTDIGQNRENSGKIVEKDKIEKYSIEIYIIFYLFNI